MIKIKKGSPLQSFALWRNVREMFLHHQHGWGLAALGGAILVLSLLAGWQGGATVQVIRAGDIAVQDVSAPKDMQVVDFNATLYLQEQAVEAEPTIWNLDAGLAETFKAGVLTFMRRLNRQASQGEGMRELAEEFNQMHGSNLPEFYFTILADPVVQSYMLNKIMPWLEPRLWEGVMPDATPGVLRSESVLAREEREDGREKMTRLYGVPVRSDVLARIEQFVHTAPELGPQEGLAFMAMMELFVQPTLTFNKEATDRRNEQIIATVEPVTYVIKQGEVVVRAGDRVSQQQQLIIQNIAGQQNSLFDTQVVAGTLVLGLMLSLGLFMTPSGNKGKVLQNRDQYFIALLLLVFGAAAWGLGRAVLPMGGIGRVLVFSFPLAGGAGLAALIFSAKRYCCVGILLSFFCTVMLKGDFFLFSFFFLAAMFNTWLVLRAQNRQDVVWSGLLLIVWLAVTGLGAGLGTHVGFVHLPILFLALTINAVLSVFLLFALSPVIEMSMGFTTRFRLMELMNLEHPLLQNLMMSSPGTYHHSLLVSYLVEAAAGAVGANSLLCKVGALYHDIGKLSRPDYFVENQFGGPNPHDNLAPSMSGLILTSHVKEGADLADEYKLGREIKDIIIQHHGSRCISYFFQRAKDMGENPRLGDYSYPGPKPQSSEAAIVMIADAVEASSRTLVDPTPARIRAHVEKIIMGIYEEGQLDESELTFKDLTKLTDGFVRILTGLFHKRISYPEKEPTPGVNGGGTPAGNGAPSGGKGQASEHGVAGAQVRRGPLHTHGGYGGKHSHNPQTVKVALNTAKLGRTTGVPKDMTGTMTGGMRRAGKADKPAVREA